jgi:hypothetical protein
MLSWFTFVSADKPLGASTTFVRAVGFAETAVAPAHVAANAYFDKTGIKVNWQMLLVVGMFFGAWASSRLSGDRQIEKVPALWKARFGPGVWNRYLWAFTAGLCCCSVQGWPVAALAVMASAARCNWLSRDGRSSSPCLRRAWQPAWLCSER